MPYDPWADINDDGIIDIYDLVNMANKYGATGDPTKNVTIIYKTYECAGTAVINPGDSFYIENETRGYREVTIGVGLSGGGPDEVEIIVRFLVEYEGYRWMISEETFTVPAMKHVAMTYPVKGSLLWILIHNYPSATKVAYVGWAVYITQ
jgi:hypothetical protein